ncbi:MAG: elongation factor Ts [Chloroflexi bacterium]|nr:elongation factor Ts [Chloroflexota bacterium]
MIKDLRQATGAGVLDCRKTLEDCGGDFGAATQLLREKGLAAVAERSERVASEGLIEAYVHPGSRVGVLLELNCETDFVARTDDFKSLAHDLTLHIAFAAPKYVDREQVPADVLEAERSAYRVEALEEGKPANIVDRIVEGKVEKFYKQVCLMEQPFVKDDAKTIQDLVSDVAAKLGENVILRRFIRYERGEDL